MIRLRRTMFAVAIAGSMVAGGVIGAVVYNASTIAANAAFHCVSSSAPAISSVSATASSLLRVVRAQSRKKVCSHVGLQCGDKEILH